ncbi:3-isopropylmalate dehydratase large subunit [Eilatimonas milleporae]|uniref:3-isopropylmalate dehydratase large subunit n=1 Tax=Eilatimonas milleporae TaxID=911205 RepID=A0A3M0BZB9_9PROT|nr:3-isopropylmalate dehydratase large subunit [Eilatimonas milleporae]
MAGATLYEKIWDAHAVRHYDDGATLLYIDRHLVQEVSTPQSFLALDTSRARIHRADAHLCVADHAVPTDRETPSLKDGLARKQVERLIENAQKYGLKYLPLDGDRHGIVHVIGPEVGFTLPGTTLVCGDSHTSTHGAFGCIAFGIGASECVSVFRTQCLRLTRQKTMRVTLSGSLPHGVYAKDVILSLIARHGTGIGIGHAIEYAGPAVAGLSMEERMTLCNMTIEAGSRIGIIAPDGKTIDYLKGRPLAPQGANWDRAVTCWRSLKSDDDAVFDREIDLDVREIAPHVSWGTSPDLTINIDQRTPDPSVIADPKERDRIRKSLAYMGLEPNTPIQNVPVDHVFIGSCTNGRLEDLQAAARIIDGRKVARHVKAIVVPGSMAVRKAAEEKGLHTLFKAAGFEWRHSGCSMCVGMNDDRLQPGQRCASTSNRNFEGRQGVGGRTHLMSPAMAAAAAVKGCITDVRELLEP